MNLYPVTGNPTSDIDEAIESLLRTAVRLWVFGHGHALPNDQATSANPFLPLAEDVFWTTLLDLGWEPR